MDPNKICWIGQEVEAKTNLSGTTTKTTNGITALGCVRIDERIERDKFTETFVLRNARARACSFW